MLRIACKVGAQDRFRRSTTRRKNTCNPSLKLSPAQKTQIDKIADVYVAESTTLSGKYPMTPGSPPSQEAMAARMKSREGFTAAVNQVLNDEQKKTWQAAQASRRPPGGGMGGPGGRPPGQ